MSIIITAIDWLCPFVHFLGFIVAAGAFRKCGKKGYIIIALYFALVLFSHLAMPRINRIIAKKREENSSQETEIRLDEKIRKVQQEFWEDENNQPSIYVRNLNFPFGSILLVSGLWLIARNEKNN